MNFHILPCHIDEQMAQVQVGWWANSWHDLMNNIIKSVVKRGLKNTNCRLFSTYLTNYCLTFYQWTWPAQFCLSYTVCITCRQVNAKSRFIVNQIHNLKVPECFNSVCTQVYRVLCQTASSDLYSPLFDQRSFLVIGEKTRNSEYVIDAPWDRQGKYSIKQFVFLYPPN